MDAENGEGKSTMVRVKQSEDMGESTSPQRIQLEEMVLKDKNDGKEMETDNGLQAGLLHLPVSFSLFVSHTQQFVHKLCTKAEVDAGHGGFSAFSDVYWSLLCSFIKLLLSHSPEAAHSLTLSQTHCHINTTTCLGGSGTQHNSLSLFHTCKRKGVKAVIHAVNTGRF